jgi:spore germination protein YaaH
MTWLSVPSLYGDGTCTKVDDKTIKITRQTWATTDFTPGTTLKFEGNPSWNDFVEFLPYNFVFKDEDTGKVYRVVIDTTGNGVYCRPPAQNPNNSKKVVAYYPNFDIENAKASLKKYINYIDQLRVEWYALKDNGELGAAEAAGIDANTLHYWYDEEVVSYARQHGKEVVAVINNYNSKKDDFDPDRARAMLSNSTLMDKHIQDIVNLAVSKNFDGIDIDYENLYATDKDLYATFIEKLAAALHAKGKKLTTAVYAKVGDGTWNGPMAQDFKRIGAAVDEMSVMTYDLHWGTSGPGIISANDWANDCLWYAISQVDDPTKVQLGIPFYGRDWGGQPWGVPAPGVTYIEAKQLVVQYNPIINHDPNGGDAYFTYTKDGVQHKVYYQDGYSIEFKLNTFDEHGLGYYSKGIIIWRLGSEGDEMWNAIAKKLKNAGN